MSTICMPSFRLWIQILKKIEPRIDSRSLQENDSKKFLKHALVLETRYTMFTAFLIFHDNIYDRKESDF